MNKGRGQYLKEQNEREQKRTRNIQPREGEMLAYSNIYIMNFDFKLSCCCVCLKR